MGVRSLTICCGKPTILLRERTPLEIVLYAIYLYLSGLSLRQTARTLASIGIARSHEAVRLWVHKLAAKTEKMINSEKAEIAIVDKTAVNVGGRQVWLWVAIEPERRILLALNLSETKNILVAYSFLYALKQRGVKRVVTDGAKWYFASARWAGLGHKVVSEASIATSSILYARLRTGLEASTFI